MEGRKIYRFTVRWGIETDTDDADGRATETSDLRPTPEAIRTALPAFTGVIEQTPPRFSALKIDGARAYDLARQGEAVELAPRQANIYRLETIDLPDRDRAVFEADCGKGTYVRALARDLGRSLGCFGHVEVLRRTRVGPFTAEESITIEALARVADEGGTEALDAVLKPVEIGLESLPAVSVSRSDAQRLALGQSVILRGRDAPFAEGLVSVRAQGALVALAALEQGSLKPRRIFNLPR
jgi:tRNA pseudouridine55 synthase